MITEAMIQEAFEHFKDGPIACEEWAEIEGIELKELVFWCAEYITENFGIIPKTLGSSSLPDISVLCTAMIMGLRFGVYAARKEASEFSFSETGE